MDESALLSSLKSLEMRWSVLEFWLKVCAAVVVLGVVVEVFVVIREWRHDWREFRRGTIHSPDKPLISNLVWGLFGAALVAIGVSGELLVGVKAGKVETEMRDTADTLVALVDKEAGDVRLKAAQLESKITDRHVTLDQRKKMLEVLAPGRGTPIAIGYLTDSGADAPGYSLELAEVFCEARWLVFRPIRLMAYNPPVHGFLLDQTDDPSSKKSVGLIKRALAVTGYNTSAHSPTGFTLGGDTPSCKTPVPSASNPPWYPTALEILVGSK
jgi:hypothetical protein